MNERDTEKNLTTNGSILKIFFNFLLAFEKVLTDQFFVYMTN